jgi:hypothetical protein
MDNFSVPAALKTWIDQVTFPRMSLAGKDPPSLGRVAAPALIVAGVVLARVTS